MKNRKRYGIYLLISVNVLFWLGWMHIEITQYYNGAEFYERIEILKEQAQYEAYINGSSKEKSEFLNIAVPQERLEKYTLWYCTQKTLMLFLPFIALIYTNWLLLIPRFLAKKKYWKYSIGLVATLLGISFVLSFNDMFGSGSKWMTGESGTIVFTFNAMMEAFGAGILALGFSTPVYLSYNWFTQQNKISNLENDRLNTELALLKSQINPHFFFNTLNNLYSLTLDNSKLASTVILKLSDLMRYTIYEGREEQVELWQEIECLENYLSLQEIRTQKQVKVEFKKRIDDDKILVPPLLFLGFLENAFKHGVDSLREDAFIFLELTIDHGYIHFSMLNNYDREERPIGGGTGLENVKRRLELLYPKTHKLEIVDQNEIFRVDLRIEN